MPSKNQELQGIWKDFWSVQSMGAPQNTWRGKTETFKHRFWQLRNLRGSEVVGWVQRACVRHRKPQNKTNRHKVGYLQEAPSPPKRSQRVSEPHLPWLILPGSSPVDSHQRLRIQRGSLRVQHMLTSSGSRLTFFWSSPKPQVSCCRGGVHAQYEPWCILLATTISRGQNWTHQTINEKLCSCESWSKLLAA